jgi:hypothetical protein
MSLRTSFRVVVLCLLGAAASSCAPNGTIEAPSDEQGGSVAEAFAAWQRGSLESETNGAHQRQLVQQQPQLFEQVDSDGDGVNDYVEGQLGTNPNDKTDYPNAAALDALDDAGWKKVLPIPPKVGPNHQYSNCVGTALYGLGQLPAPDHIPSKTPIDNYIASNGLKPYAGGVITDPSTLKNGLVVVSGKLPNGSDFYDVGRIVGGKTGPDGSITITVKTQPGLGNPVYTYDIPLKNPGKPIPGVPITPVIYPPRGAK